MPVDLRHIIIAHYQPGKTEMTCTCGWRHQFATLDPPTSEVNRRGGLHSYRGPVAGAGVSRPASVLRWLMFGAPRAGQGRAT